MKQPKPAPEPEKPKLRQFTVDGVVYTEGDTLQVIAPELGLLTVTCGFHDYSSAHIVSFDFGWVTTPMPCRTNTVNPNSPNARLSFVATRLKSTGYTSLRNELRIVYFCFCPENRHNSVIWWGNCSFENGVIRSEKIGSYPYRTDLPHTHPLVEGYEHLKPLALAPVSREPTIIETPAPGTQASIFSLF